MHIGVGSLTNNASCDCGACTAVRAQARPCRARNVIGQWAFAEIGCLYGRASMAGREAGRCVKISLRQYVKSTLFRCL